MKEIWKDISGSNAWYQVSNCGDVRSLDRWRTLRDGSRHFYKGKVLKAGKHRDGYLQVVIWVKDKLKTVKNHRLVADHFIPNLRGYKEVNHRDGVKSNNHLSNLEWCSRSQNVKHAFSVGLASNVGVSNPSAKLNVRQIRVIKHIKSIPNHISQKAIAKIFSVNVRNIASIWGNRIWKGVII